MLSLRAALLYVCGCGLLWIVDWSLGREAVWRIPSDWAIWAWAAKPIGLLGATAALTAAFRSLMRKDALTQ